MSHLADTIDVCMPNLETSDPIEDGGLPVVCWGKGGKYCTAISVPRSGLISQLAGYSFLLCVPLPGLDLFLVQKFSKKKKNKLHIDPDSSFQIALL